MKRILLLLSFVISSLSFSSVAAQERRPVDSQHPLWLVHVDVWNSADPQKIIDLIPDDIKPFVCMNLSLSCQYDTGTNMYRMPRCAVRTYKSWASVCQQNGMWFTCQPASGGHTHIQDDDLETFEYFFKTYPNFLGWNYAEQFWGFDEAGDKSSSTQASRIALFAKLVPMHHKYGGFLTVSFCGNVWSHPLNPIGMMKRNTTLMKACKDYPEAILWLYKYTTSSCFYNNESVTFGPFVSGLAKNYGVRYDNCGWNGALDAILGDGHGKKYPGAAGIGTVMEQTCVNGGAVWDGPELIWTEDFQNLSNTTVDGYTRRNWGTFPNFKGVWLDMFRQIINGTMYIPTREEVVGKIKIAVQNDISASSSSNDEQKYAAWGDLYDGLYKQTDPFNRGNGQWMDNFCYFKSTGRYGAIPIVTGFYDDAAKKIPVQVKKSQYTSRWGTLAKKTADFDAQYPEVSKGDLYVNRYRNQLVTYTPYTYLNKKRTAQGDIPLQYNTCDSLKLTYGKLSSGIIREYEDHIDFYLNNYRSDSTTVQTDIIVVTGVTAEPSNKLSTHATGATGQNASVTANYDAEAKTYTLNVKHMGPLTLTVNCQGGNDRSSVPSAAIALQPLEQPQQPQPFTGKIVIEAENMDYKSVKSVALTHSGWWAQDYQEFAGMGYVEMGTNTSAALRHQLKLAQAGDYDILIRYCNTTKAGSVRVTVNGTAQTLTCEKVNKNDWRKLKLQATLKAGTNDLVIANTGATGMVIDQIIYQPTGTPEEKFLVTMREAEHGSVSADVSEAAEGQTVTLTAHPDAGCQLKELRIVNSVYYTMMKTIAISDPTGEITFTMPDDNVTIQPVFADMSAAYKLDFTNVQNGTIPEGWRCVQEDNGVHEYPNSYSSGARTFQGFTGYQGKALYWRNDCAEYGRQTAYPLTLEPGDYKLTFAMAAWKESPKYKVQILNAQGSAVAASQVFTATPNTNGSTSASVASATTRTLDFSISEKGKYIIRFSDETGTGGYHEFLLLECRINSDVAAGMAPVVMAARQQSVGIYAPSGRQLRTLQRGLNIIVEADGTVRKVMKK
ncbi:MAG: glycosyl hydrolase family 98 [Prevotella sp.]|nr:glycosyl hydrolase family 98 [Prevotella sp.]